MSLLDDLKRQADELQNNENRNTDEARMEARYQEKLRPCMQLILSYFRQLTEQLKIVDPDVRYDYCLPGIGDAKSLRQGGYIVNADSTDQTKTIRLRFSCAAEQEGVYAVKSKEKANETRDFLESQNMRYAEWPIRDNHQQIIGINYQLTVRVNISFTFQADLEQGVIRMVTTNFNGIGVDRSVLKPERIDDQWLDNLGHYLLRKNQNLHNLEINDTAKVLIREKLEADKRVRQKELEQAIEREQMELEEKRKNSLLGKLRNLGKK